jgi:hypothetical protein
LEREKSMCDICRDKNKNKNKNKNKQPKTNKKVMAKG